MQSVCIFETPIGNMRIEGGENGILRVDYTEEEPMGQDTASDLVKTCKDQLLEYFDGKRQSFDILLAPQGTEFRKKVWDALLGIPYGETITYGELARRIGNPKASRAVGGANHHNPINIIIPCHRVIGADGALTGYGGGISRKEYLLKLEKEHHDL